MTHFIIKALTLLTVLAVSTPASADNGPIGGGPWKPTSAVAVSTLF